MAEAAGSFLCAVVVGDHFYIAGTTTQSHISGDYYERNVPSVPVEIEAAL
jgi:hypothetical protein